ncbi:MAG: methyltransferase family protein [Candidatus Helarchaeota archaeon]
MTVFHFIVLLLVAWNWLWINAWIYFIIGISCQTINFIILYNLNPQLLNERGKVVYMTTKTYDRVFMILFTVLLILSPIVVGFDARFRLPYMPFNFLMLQFLSFNLCILFMIIGIIIFILAFFLGTWAMVENTNFTVLIRTQDDREHLVCMTGPYKIIRHPGYAAEIIGSIGYIFILGTWWALIPIVGIITLFIIRTVLEDHTLQDELAGYKEYTKKTKYRLIPFIW